VFSAQWNNRGRSDSALPGLNTLEYEAGKWPWDLQMAPEMLTWREQWFRMLSDATFLLCGIIISCIPMPHSVEWRNSGIPFRKVKLKCLSF
jgi:hypothetical protein